MSANHSQNKKFGQLREKAEELLKKRQHTDFNPPSDMLDLVRELEVHQAELELQNEELKKSQLELSSLYQKYEDLYEFAPCGYLTLDEKGFITRANRSAVRIFLGSRKHPAFFFFSQVYCSRMETSLHRVPPAS